METLENLPNTAILVIDVQRGVVEGAHERDAVVASALAGLGVGRLVVVGAQTDQCVRSTLHGAFVRGYDTDEVDFSATG